MLIDRHAISLSPTLLQSLSHPPSCNLSLTHPPAISLSPTLLQSLSHPPSCNLSLTHPPAISLSPTLLQAFLHVSLTCTHFLLSVQHSHNESSRGEKKEKKKKRLKMARNHQKLRLDQPTDTQWWVHKQKTYWTKLSSSALCRPHTKIADKKASR